MNAKEQLTHLRQIRSKIDNPADLVPWLTVDVLQAAEFRVYANYPHCHLCRTRARRARGSGEFGQWHDRREQVGRSAQEGSTRLHRQR